MSFIFCSIVAVLAQGFFLSDSFEVCWYLCVPLAVTLATLRSAQTVPCVRVTWL
jgi:hypothetical protein